MTQSTHTPGPIAEAFELLDNPQARRFIAAHMGEQAKLHRVLNALRPAGACAVREAAPELLECLETIKLNFDEGRAMAPGTPSYHMLCEAIAKARGQ